MRVYGALDEFKLLHELFVDMEAAGGIDEQQVTEPSFCLIERLLADCNRRCLRIRIVHRQIDFLAEDLELFDSSGAIDVGGNQIGSSFLISFQIPRQLGHGGSLTRPLQADQHDHYGRGGFEVELTMLATQQTGQFVTDYFEELLLG